MKYHQLAAFQKHLQQPSQMGLSHLFFVVVSCAYERGRIVQEIVGKIREKHGEIDVLHKEVESADVGEVLEDMQTLSLFSLPKVVYFEPIDRLKKGEIERLARYVEKPSNSGYLILGAASFKGLNDLYTRGKKEFIGCDLSEEKPAEFKIRLTRDLLERVRGYSKQIAPDALDLLFDRVGLVRPSLEQEIDKLVCYMGEQEKISIEAVRTLVAPQKPAYLFELIDQMLWTSKRCTLPSHEAQELLFPLISQLKQQLQQGLVIAHLQARRLSVEEMMTHLPQMKPFVVEKWVGKVRQTSLPFLRQALDVLFEIELMAKNSSFEPIFVFDLLVSKLDFLKKGIHALSSAKRAQ